MVEQDCGCETEYDHEDQDCGDITYCPMHKAAPEMQKALEEVRRIAGNDPTIDATLIKIQRVAKPVLAQARGQEAKREGD